MSKSKQQRRQQQAKPKPQRSSPPKLCTKEMSVPLTAPVSTCDSSSASWSEMALGSSESSAGGAGATQEHDMVTFHRLNEGGAEGNSGGPRRSPPQLTLTVEPAPAPAPAVPPVDIPWRLVDPDSTSNPMQEALSHSLALMEQRMYGRHAKNAPTTSNTAAHHHHRRTMSALPIGQVHAQGGGLHARAATFAGGRGDDGAVAVAARNAFWKQTPPPPATVASGSFDDDNDFHDDEVSGPRERGICGRRQRVAFEGYFPEEDKTGAADTAVATDGGDFDSACVSSSIQEEEEDGVVNVNDAVRRSFFDGDGADEEDGADSDDMIFDFDDIQVVMGSGLQQEELGSEEFDALLHPNVLDTLADFDLSYTDLGGGGGLDAGQKQQQPTTPTSPKPLAGRKRSFTQACTWDNVGPKALSEISASLLAGGGWEGVQAPPAPGTPPGAFTVNPPGPACSSVPPAAAAAAAAAPPKQEAGDRLVGGYNRKAPGAVGCGKGRRGSGAGAGTGGEGAGKRPLNPERMERKASREKRRREEVNEKFDQLMEVLEDAEVTSGLEPPASKEGGKAGPACINGRRVEVLSRTINIIKKLLQARRQSLAAAAAAAAAAGEEEEPVPHSPGNAAVDQEGASAAASAVCDSPGGGSAPSASFTANAAANAAAEVADAACSAPEPEARGAAETAAATPQAVVHHVAMPMSGHHASLMMPPGFAGIQAPHGMPPGQHGLPGHQGQPIFIAVPMYMPQGQGVTSSSSSAATASDNAAQAPASAAAAPLLPAVPAATPSAADAPSAVVAETKEAVGMAPPVKWAIPAGMGFPQMSLQMPQFVAQALSAEEGDENPTHAVCA
eukprot:g18904.t1